MVSNKPLFLSFIIASFSFSLASCQRCSNQVDFGYYSCEQACTPIQSGLSLIECCSKLRPFGCVLKACEGGFECTATRGREIGTCANSKVIFRDADPRKKIFNFRIDLNTPPLAGDYYFLISASPRLTGILPVLKRSVIDFINSVNGSATVRFGVGIFLSEDMLDMGYQNFVHLTKNHERVRNAVNNIVPQGSGRGPGANLQALVKASAQPFRAEARKMIFLLGGPPGHEPSKVGDAEPLTRVVVANILKDANISLIAIDYIRNGLQAPTESFGVSPVVQTEGGQARFIAKETGGVQVFRGQTVFTAFWAAKSSITRKFDLDEFTCRRLIKVLPGGTGFPVIVRRRRSAVVSLRLRIRRGLCVPFTCQYRITENGTELQRFTIEVPPRDNDDPSCM